MSTTMNYQTRRYSHIGHDELYIDHHDKNGTWNRFKNQLKHGTELFNARWKIMVDKQLRASYWTNLVRNYLRGVGLSGLDMLKPETFYISKLLHKDEKILGAVVGKLDEGGSALIVVTDLRVIYLNQIPLFTKMDEVGYAIITGISSNDGRWESTVTLHTGVGDFKLHNVNPAAAKTFVTAIERIAIDNRSAFSQVT